MKYMETFSKELEKCEAMVSVLSGLTGHSILTLSLPPPHLHPTISKPRLALTEIVYFFHGYSVSQKLDYKLDGDRSPIFSASMPSC